MWSFNQRSVEQALKFIGEEENMNLRFREGVALWLITQILLKNINGDI